VQQAGKAHIRLNSVDLVFFVQLDAPAHPIGIVYNAPWTGAEATAAADGLQGVLQRWQVSHPQHTSALSCGDSSLDHCFKQRALTNQKGGVLTRAASWSANGDDIVKAYRSLPLVGLLWPWSCQAPWAFSRQQQCRSFQWW